ncbi:srs domain-containing protein [Neospora caninum Liverpool]|uniref:Srs domain-containing protein n=1 Tax=Neospora caninum (strain Liverpool) TaxID=572307 RepID=F0VCF5_NEOCL|nr:srs domain-containing protein [Neospora caninum Liverpool]CBZ51277.1 srs domain-containing protein [Neospora caninum Liverpool]CEL68592.1 TPA: SRS domain-containing protein [Neospora caninum Liverpool]|eukprot:XP_003881310.1 srs domain-containing protein [Neospora caninum Liverpool]
MERRISFSSRSCEAVRLVAAVCFVACLSRLSTAADAETIQPKCTQQNQVTTCVCSEPGVGAKEVRNSSPTVTLSESSAGITIECSPSTTFDFVPEADTKVCVATEIDQQTLKLCKSTSNTSIRDFLTQDNASSVPSWTQVKKTTTKKSLTIPPEDLPLTDKSFFAGCQNSTSANDECVVSVSVKARTSAVKDGVLICAYGKESNSSVPEVTLNSENNSLTILCGSEGQMEPTQQSLTAYHCTGSHTTDCKKVNLTEIMPTFTSSWWTTDELNSKAPKLVIPEDGFPAQEETILLGCNLNNNVVSRHEDDNGTTAAQLPTCKVKVTLAASSSRSQASSVSFRGLFVLVFVPLVLLGTC